MKRMLATLGAALMMLGLFGVSQATAEPGPNGKNNKGLCTAYFNGQKNGHDKNGDPGPFQALEDQAAGQDGEDNDGDGQTDEPGETRRIDDSSEEGDLEQAEAVYRFCDNVVIGGNPEHGRYTCVADDPTTSEAGDTNCTRNDAPGGGKGKSKRTA